MLGFHIVVLLLFSMGIILAFVAIARGELHFAIWTLHKQKSPFVFWLSLSLMLLYAIPNAVVVGKFLIEELNR